MYKVYCVSYDLHKTGKDYKGLIEELKKSTLWWHHLESFWLIKTTESANELWTRISSHFDGDDNCLVIKVTVDYQGWLSKEAWKWIEANIS